MPEGKDYPTIEEVITHTAGYKAYYFESPMISNYLNGRNAFYGISKENILEKAGEVNQKKEEYSFSYSNFGYAVLGLILEEIYQQDYTVLMSDFVEEMGLYNTGFSSENGDLNNYWSWEDGDAYISVGALNSNISDMMKYANIQLQNQYSYITFSHETRKQINATPDDYNRLGIRLDDIGMG